MIRKLKRRVILLQILSFLVSITPLVITVAVKWDSYVTVQSDAVKLSIGAIMVAVLIFFKAIGKLKMPQRRIITYLFLLVLCYMLQAILNDIIFLLGMATAGEFADLIFFQRPIRLSKEKLELEKTSDAVGAKVESIVEKYLGGKP